MHLEYTPEQQQLRAELRTYFAALVPDNTYGRDPEGTRGAPSPTPPPRSASTARPCAGLGADGWLGVGWPKEFGGRGLSPMEQFIFFDEAAQAGCRCR